MQRHETDYFSLAAGLFFTILGLVLVAAALGDWTVDGRWIAPTMLIALGAGGIAASLAATNRQRREAEAVSSTTTDSDSWPTDPFA